MRNPDRESSASLERVGCPAFWVFTAQELLGNACCIAGFPPAPSKDHLLHQSKPPGTP